jgi:hypothetical protein
LATPNNGNSFKKNKWSNAANGNNNEIEKECVLEFGSSNDKSKKSSNHRRSRAEPGYLKKPLFELDSQDLADIDDFIQEQELQGNLLGSKHRPYEQKQNSRDLPTNNNRQPHNSHNNLMQEEENWSHNSIHYQNQNIDNTKEELEFSDEEEFVLRPKRKKNSDIFGDKSAKPSIKKVSGTFPIDHDNSPNFWNQNQTPVKNDEFFIEENGSHVPPSPPDNKMIEENFSPNSNPVNPNPNAQSIPKSDLTRGQTQMDNQNIRRQLKRLMKNKRDENEAQQMQSAENRKKSTDVNLLSQVTSAKRDCCICYTDEVKSAGLLDCNHYFCFECISDWAKVTNLCPLCKGPFTRIRKIDNGSEVEIVQVSERKINADELLDYQYDISNADDFCYACEGREHTDQMLVCDFCSRKCCHIGCLIPALREIPYDDWYCDYCVRENGINSENPIAHIFDRRFDRRRRNANTNDAAGNNNDHGNGNGNREMPPGNRNRNARPRFGTRRNPQRINPSEADLQSQALENNSEDSSDSDGISEDDNQGGPNGSRQTARGRVQTRASRNINTNTNATENLATVFARPNGRVQTRNDRRAQVPNHIFSDKTLGSQPTNQSQQQTTIWWHVDQLSQQV